MKKILHIFIFTFILVAMLCVTASAAEWTDADGRTWLFSTNATDKTATITGAKLKTGEKRTSELNIPAKVIVDEVEYTVTKIGAKAFWLDGSFSHSNALNKKYFGHVTFPDTLLEIGESAFAYSAIFGEIEFPSSIVTIGKNAFQGCVGLDTVIFPETVTSIPSACFSGCKALTTVISKGAILDYGSYCFDGCEALLKIDISPKTNSIDSYAFRNCLCLSNDLVLTDLTKMGDYAFQNCPFIEKVSIATCEFPFNAFTGNKNLKSFSVGENHTKYKTINGILFSKDEKTLYRYPAGKYDTTYTIPETVVTVESYAFSNAESLKKIIIGSNVTTIKSYAFSATGVENVYFPKNVTSVGEHVLESCKSLIWVVFEDSITSLNSNMVSNNSSYPLKAVFSKATNPSGSYPGGAKYALYTPSLGCIALKDEYLGEHIYGYVDEAVSCDKGGNNICCLCGEKTPVDPLGHVGEIVSTSTLSCTTNNSVTINCINCNTLTEVIIEKAKGHTESAVQAGSSAFESHSYTQCTVCGEITVKSFETSVYKSGDINADGTIDDKDIALLGKILGGSASYANRFACDVNSDGAVNSLDLLVLKQYVAKLNVTLKNSTSTCANHARISTVTLCQLSCTSGGATVSFCTDCGSVVDEVVSVAKGHIYYYEPNPEKPATCSKKGETTRKCYACDIAEVIETEQLPHTFNWWMLSDTEIDYQYSNCSVCGAFASQEVNRGALQQIVESIPENYTHYCEAESAAELKPIIENAKKALTQEQVDQTILAIREALPKLKYKVTDVPVIYLETTEYLNRSYYIPANIIVAFTDENGELQTISDSEGEMRIRGNYTASASYKQPYNIKFSRKVNLLGMGMGKKYCLLANAYDPTTIRNALAFEFAADLGLDYTCKYTICDVYYNGVFKGCYMATTPTDIGEDRVDINEETDVVIHLSQSNGSQDAAFPSPIFNIQYMRLEQPAEYTAYTRSQMMRIMYQLDFAILSGDTDEMAKYMDLDSMVQFYVFHEYVKDMDIIWDSTRFYIEDGKLHGGPAWDLDISQGNVSRTQGGTNLDAGHYYWHRMNYASGVTKAEVDAAGEMGSALGVWTSVPWAPKGNERWWYYYLAIYSDEFMTLVAECIRDNQDMIKQYYSKDLKDEDDNAVNCIIEDIALNGDTGKAIARNFMQGPYGVTSVAIYKTSKTIPDAVEYLRSWWQTRNEWVYEYYTSTYLSEDTATK